MRHALIERLETDDEREQREKAGMSGLEVSFYRSLALQEISMSVFSNMSSSVLLEQKLIQQNIESNATFTAELAPAAISHIDGVQERECMLSA